MAQGFAPFYFFAVLFASVFVVAGQLSWSLEEEKVLVLDADCLQGMVLVRWFFSEGTELDLFEGVR